MNSVNCRQQKTSLPLIIILSVILLVTILIPVSEAYADISGSCKRVDQVTNCSDTGTVRFAVNGILQPQMQTTVGGTWTISGINPLVSGDVITIFIDGASNIREAIAVTKYDGIGSITGVELIEKHLTIGSDDNQTISNTDLSLYDNSASGDEDIFYEVNGDNDLTVDVFGSYTTEELYIKNGNTFRPDSAGSGNITTQDLEINGTLIADSNSITLTGSWDNNATFIAGTSTVNFTAVSDTERIDSTGAITPDFYNISFNDGGGTAIYMMDSALSVSNDLSVIDGILNTKGGSNYPINVGNDFLQSGGGVEARSSTLTVARHFTANGSEISDGYNDAHLVMNGTGTLTYNNLSSPWNNGFNDLTVGQSGNTTTLIKNIAVRDQLMVGSGSLSGNSRSIYLVGSPTPLVVNNNSTIDINQLRFFNLGIQHIPTLINGYDSTIRVSRGGTIVNQTGAVTINAGSDLIIDGDNFANSTSTYNSNGFDLTVGGDIKIGSTNNDTVQKRLDITNSTVTVAGDIDIRSMGSGSVQADLISTGSTVTMNGSSLQTITMNGSDFNNLVVTNTSASGVTFSDSFTVNNFTNTMANSKMTFTAGQTYTINSAVTLQGATGQLQTLASSSPGTHWNLVLNNGATKVIDYVNVSWSDASGSHSTNTPILPTNSSDGGNNINWFGPNIVVNKTSTLISDPINGTGVGKNHIPGAIVEFTITTTNLGDSSPDTNSITLSIPIDAEVEYDVTSGVSLNTANSGLSLNTVTYTDLANQSYTPIGSYDPNVASIEITTSGTFNHTDTPSPGFTVTYRVRIK